MLWSARPKICTNWWPAGNACDKTRPLSLLGKETAWVFRKWFRLQFMPLLSFLRVESFVGGRFASLESRDFMISPMRNQWSIYLAMIYIFSAI